MKFEVGKEYVHNGLVKPSVGHKARVVDANEWGAALLFLSGHYDGTYGVCSHVDGARYWRPAPRADAGDDLGQTGGNRGREHTMTDELTQERVRAALEWIGRLQTLPSLPPVRSNMATVAALARAHLANADAILRAERQKGAEAMREACRGVLARALVDFGVYDSEEIALRHGVKGIDALEIQP